jgi:hypothetical protein
LLKNEARTLMTRSTEVNAHTKVNARGNVVRKSSEHFDVDGLATRGVFVGGEHRLERAGRERLLRGCLNAVGVAERVRVHLPIAKLKQQQQQQQQQQQHMLRMISQC